jgi:hypothetical protein
MRLHAGDSTYLATYGTILLACAVWLAVPNAQKHLAGDSTIAYSGSWTPQTYYNGCNANSYQTLQNGATATVHLTGTAIYIGYTNRAGLGDGGTLTVNVDGTDMATIDESTGSTGGVFTYWPEVLRLSGLSSGSHTVIITANVTTGKKCNIDWFADNSHAETTGSPRIYLGNTIKATAAGYAAVGGSDEAVAAWNFVNAAVVAGLVADGLRVVYVDACSTYDPNTMSQADGVHPNDTGQVTIANAFLALMAA